MAWYRQYRPRLIAELNIQVVREALQKMMAAGKIPQALLFAGPKGTGKTSTARILGVLLNDPVNEALVEQLYLGKGAGKKKLSFQEPNPETDFARRVYEGSSFVVQEMDAASNRRIDDIRQLKERIFVPPSEGKMMVYILDEVHMLTTEAFNALLKILEEPPAHVVFILATTEIEKVPETIISRCTVLPFQKASGAEIQAALARILQAEKISFQEEALLPIVERADGSFRDAVKLLEEACQTGQLDMAVIADRLATNNQTFILKLLQATIQKDRSSVLSLCQELRQHQRSEKEFQRDLLQFLHQDLLKNMTVIEGETVFTAKIDQFFLKEFLEIENQLSAQLPFLATELRCLEIIDRATRSGDPENQAGPRSASGKSQPNSTESTKVARSSTKTESQTEENLETFSAPETVQMAQPSLNLSSSQDPDTVASFDLAGKSLQEFWQEFLRAMQVENFSLTTLLKSCQLLEIQNAAVTIAVYYPFHKEQLEQVKNQALLSQKCHELFGQDLQFQFVLAKEHQEPETISKDAPGEDFLVMAKDALI